MKRPKGSGSLTLRGRIWWMRYTVDGVPYQESTYTDDRQEAERQLYEKIGEAAKGEFTPPNKTTVGDLCKLVFDDYELRGLKDLDGIQDRYRKHIEPLWGSMLARRFGPHHVRQYVALRQKQAANATINRELSIVRRGFTLGLRETPPAVHHAPYILKLEEDNVREGFIEEGQYLALRAALPNHLKAIFVVGYHIGCRLGELRKFRWSQIDFEALQIRVERKQAKRKKPRTIPIYGDMLEWLEFQRSLHHPRTDLVFHWNGKQLGEHLKGWARACEQAGLTGLLFHDLRRSAIRNMERAGLARSQGMAISGHTTEAVYKRYDIVDNDDLEDAGQKLKRYLEEKRAKALLHRVK